MVTISNTHTAISNTAHLRDWHCWMWMLWMAGWASCRYTPGRSDMSSVVWRPGHVTRDMLHVTCYT